jgi:hypothetical protein
MSLMHKRATRTSRTPSNQRQHQAQEEIYRLRMAGTDRFAVRLEQDDPGDAARASLRVLERVQGARYRGGGLTPRPFTPRIAPAISSPMRRPAPGE